MLCLILSKKNALICQIQKRHTKNTENSTKATFFFMTHKCMYCGYSVLEMTLALEKKVTAGVSETDTDPGGSATSH